MGELALVGDHSTVPLTRISCNTVFSKSQNERKVGTPCSTFFAAQNSYYTEADFEVLIFEVLEFSYLYLSGRIQSSAQHGFYLPNILDVIYR